MPVKIPIDKSIQYAIGPEVGPGEKITRPTVEIDESMNVNTTWLTLDLMVDRRFAITLPLPESGRDFTKKLGCYIRVEGLLGGKTFWGFIESVQYGVDFFDREYEKLTIVRLP